jgi:hypothetical protein
VRGKRGHRRAQGFQRDGGDADARGWFQGGQNILFGSSYLVAITTQTSNAKQSDSFCR